MKLDVIYNKSSQHMNELPDESIDMSMTSPPYYGLRDYGEDVREIWGGDPGCKHDFNEYVRPAGGGHPNPDKAGVNATKNDVQRVYGAKAAFCQCGAWHGQLGLEPTFQLYLDHLMIVCAEVMRVLKKTGSFWLNMGDTYGGSWGDSYSSGRGKPNSQREQTFPSWYRKAQPRERPPQSSKKIRAKCLFGIPWRLVLRLIDEQNWILRNSIIWHKSNAMPSSVKDRCSNSYEFLFHLVKARRYYYDLDEIRNLVSPNWKYGGGAPMPQLGKHVAKEGQRGHQAKRVYEIAKGKNPGDVWTISTQPRPEAHFATFPDKFCIKPILATCPKDTGILLDPFAGRGTSLIMAKKLGRHYVGYELKKEYWQMAERELEEIDPLFKKEQ